MGQTRSEKPKVMGQSRVEAPQVVGQLGWDTYLYRIYGRLGTMMELADCSQPWDILCVFLLRPW